MALDADWNVIKGLYTKGYNFAQIARQTGVSAIAIRKHAERAGWKSTQASIQAAVFSDESIAERGQLWCVRMMSLCETMMSQLQSKVTGKVGVKALETLVRVANTLDQIGRRTFGLDAQDGTRSRLEILVNVNEPGERAKPERFIDVQTVDAVPKQDTSSVLTPQLPK